MSKPMYPRGPTVRISDHAWERWLERTSRWPKKRGSLAALIETMLNSRFGHGVPMEPGLACNLDMGGGVIAVLRLTDSAWVCTTVIDINIPREAKA